MDDTNTIPTMDEARKQADAISGAVLDWGVSPLLNAQADILADAEATLSGWLHRRHEAVDDARRLIAGMHPGGLSETLQAQSEWLSRSLRRLAADAEAYHATARKMLDRAPAWFPEGGWSWFARNADHVATEAARPFQMANNRD